MLCDSKSNENEQSKPIFTKTITKEDKYFFSNTLAGLVKALEGQYTTIDFRNEACVTGKISHVDAKMNVEMEDAVFYDPMGAEHIFPKFFVNKRNIRYVHIPKKTPSVELIGRQLTQMEKKKVKDPHTYKKSQGKTIQR
ncbi:hypothetical protein NQ315_015122 [Exocentrus adspersus]|uniref:Sm domain-containing protein n=1 Tax=Exocentrus adspersus TaxID=1586481 RepID=A0AAV8VA51_9CUCU|nr:hypothetical protein NQ315_015122 [Exocentrus adspersus]